jgi:hypothetical protein
MHNGALDEQGIRDLVAELDAAADRELEDPRGRLE